MLYIPFRKLINCRYWDVWNCTDLCGLVPIKDTMLIFLPASAVLSHQSCEYCLLIIVSIVTGPDQGPDFDGIYMLDFMPNRCYSVFQKKKYSRSFFIVNFGIFFPVQCIIIYKLWLLKSYFRHLKLYKICITVD